ncbi:conserved hypothetical protein [Neospora caninum Liverpool]|uniref:Uncharacterized protein n=1 Tax=Neospora caninum (strain Liverpool) TaxID=572307 RepID=F0VN30_NEOCL|nr:conserved hypothetical protein [Neospora caninum Liverpool]CBZ55126.1 conserved hypothetical protein [Neospora caninum Liverpool]CEL69852.1 TPA: hypothetical protein BN1204_055510 [Neospora caninum Liverpool]|eukprot:XP_003885154.1 conserved hypothetical protein [Neospora caninum Liverpool]
MNGCPSWRAAEPVPGIEPQTPVSPRRDQTSVAPQRENGAFHSLAVDAQRYRAPSSQLGRRLASRFPGDDMGAHSPEAGGVLRERGAEEPYAISFKRNRQTQAANGATGSAERHGDLTSKSLMHATAAAPRCPLRELDSCVSVSSHIRSLTFHKQVREWIILESSSFNGAPHNDRSDDEPTRFLFPSPLSSFSSSFSPALSSFSSLLGHVAPASPAFESAGGGEPRRHAPLNEASSSSPCPVASGVKASTENLELPETPGAYAASSCAHVPGSAVSPEEKDAVDLAALAHLRTQLVGLLARATPTEREALRRGLHAAGKDQGLRLDQTDWLYLSVLFQVPAFLQTATRATGARRPRDEPRERDKLKQPQCGNSEEGEGDTEQSSGDVAAHATTAERRRTVLKQNGTEQDGSERKGGERVTEADPRGGPNLWERWGEHNCESILSAQGRAVLGAVRTLQQWALSHPLDCHAGSPVCSSRSLPLHQTVAWLLQAALELLAHESEARLERKGEREASSWCEEKENGAPGERRGAGVCGQFCAGEDGLGLADGRSGRREASAIPFVARGSERNREGRRVSLALLQRLFFWTASPHPPLQALAFSIWRQIGLSTHFLSLSLPARSPCVDALESWRKGGHPPTGGACGSVERGDSATSRPGEDGNQGVFRVSEAGGLPLGRAGQETHALEKNAERGVNARELRRVFLLGRASMHLLDCLFLLATRAPQWGVLATNEDLGNKTEGEQRDQVHGDGGAPCAPPGVRSQGKTMGTKRGDKEEAEVLRGTEARSLSPLLLQFAPSLSQLHLLQCLGAALEIASEEARRELLAKRLLPYAVRTISSLKHGAPSRAPEGENAGGDTDQEGQEGNEGGGKESAPERKTGRIVEQRRLPERATSVLMLLEMLQSLPASFLACPGRLQSRGKQDSKVNKTPSFSRSCEDTSKENGCDLPSPCVSSQQGGGAADLADGSPGCTDTLMGCMDSLLEALLEIAFDRAIAQQNRQTASRNELLNGLSASLQRRIDTTLKRTREGASYLRSRPHSETPSSPSLLGCQSPVSAFSRKSPIPDASEGTKHLSGNGDAPPANGSTAADVRVMEKVRNLLSPDRVCEALRGVHTPEVDEERIAVELVCRFCTSALRWRDSSRLPGCIVSRHSVELASFLEHYLCSPQHVARGFLSPAFCSGRVRGEPGQRKGGDERSRGTTTSLLFAAALAVCCCASVGHDSQEERAAETAGARRAAKEGEDSTEDLNGRGAGDRESSTERHIERLWWVIEGGLGPMLRRRPDFLLRALMNAIVFLGTDGRGTCRLLPRLLRASEAAATLLEASGPLLPLRTLRACISVFQNASGEVRPSARWSAPSDPTQVASSADKMPAGALSLSPAGVKDGKETGLLGGAGKHLESHGDTGAGSGGVGSAERQEERRKLTQCVLRHAEAALRRGALAAWREEPEWEEEERKRERPLDEGVDSADSGQDARRRRTGTEETKAREVARLRRQASSDDASATGGRGSDASNCPSRRDEKEEQETEMEEDEEEGKGRSRGEPVSRKRRGEKAEREDFLRSVLRRLGMAARQVEEHHGFAALELRDCVALLDEEFLSARS